MSEQKQERPSSRGSREYESHKAPLIGCCVDCGCGRSACDENCVRTLALLKCRSTCDELKQQRTPVKASDNAAYNCCAPGRTNVGTCGTKIFELNCLEKQPVGTDIESCAADAVTQNNDYTNQPQHGIPTNPDKKGKGGCCTKKGSGDNCSSQISEPCCPGKQNTENAEQDVGTSRAQEAYYVEKQDESFVCQQGGCCTGKGDTLARKQGNGGTEQKPDCCTADNSGRTSPSIPKTENQSKERGACKDHLQQAMNEYLSLIQKGICICCSILDGLDTCCGRPLPNKKISDNTAIALEKSSPPAIGQQSSSSLIVQKCGKSCCGQRTTLDDIQDAEALSCCPSDNLDPEITPVLEARSSGSGVQTIEAGIANITARQHIILGVAGMTCTGCTRKVTNILNGINGVSSVNVTFVTGVAEFDLDLAVSSLQQLIPRIEKETGFKFSRIVSDHQTLDLRIDPAAAKAAFEQLRSAAVESVEQINKSTYRVNYDPAVIGARTLLSSIKGASLAPPRNDAKLVNGRRRLIRMAWITGTAMVLTIPILVLNWSNNPVPYSKRSIVSLVLATFVQAFAIPEFYVGAIKSLIYSRVIEMDMLVVISISAAYAYSVVAFALTHAGYVLETGEFFETSSLLITLVLLGRLIAAIAKVRAISAVSLRSLQAEKALLVVPSSGTLEIDARLLQLGDSFIVPAHSRIVTDGMVIDGKSSVDESMITGENVPVPKAIGDEVIAGTINCSSPLTISMTRLPGKNSITDIANLVENALAAKPRIQDLADTVAGYFIPVVVCIALIVFGIWMAVALKIRGESGGGAVGVAITYCIAVLAVSCPCALGLAVPMVLIIAGGVAARSGVIIKQADVIERGHKVTDVVFDKTGTITKGDLIVVHEQLFPHIHTSDVLSIAKSVTKENQHPVSVAVAAHLKLNSSGFARLERVESIPGAGIQCEWQGLIIKAGNPYWLNIEEQPEISTLIEQGMSLFCIMINSTLVAAFGLKANVREEAKQVIADLQRSNIRCHIVSGDGPKVVEDVAATVGIPLSNTASRHSPAQKQHYVKELMLSGHTVLFCGDGTNDAVAVAQANVGVQIGTTSDITRATADVVLLGGLDGLMILLDISKRSSRRIVFNFIWSAVYNVFAILLAGGAFVKARIPPAYAGLGEVVSVVPVIVAALTLSRTKQTN
ncbi:hypothetical protein TWF703_008884 [Orbilia oligospora]|uniref:HMA domain-containing protein n=1 Tax=Orbilia oligospora TaxID=2813651 RepID=A0A7C8JKV9_ORBOL|nr:hypothetical protein TWF703_008884 [Orbilia oligospora]